MVTKDWQPERRYLYNKNMIQFLLSLIPASLFIYGLNILFQEGHLLEKQGEWMRNKWPEYITKPLFDCAICQSSFWGIIGFFAIRYFFNVDLPLRQILPFVFCLCGLNTLLSKITSKERVIVEDE